MSQLMTLTSLCSMNVTSLVFGRKTSRGKAIPPLRRHIIASSIGYILSPRPPDITSNVKQARRHAMVYVEHLVRINFEEDDINPKALDELFLHRR